MNQKTSAAGSPVPIAIVGQNGAGKSLALSVILDAMTEARRASFSVMPEVAATDYLRISSKNYIRYRSGFSHAQVTFSLENEDIDFNEIVSALPFNEFEENSAALANLPNLRGSEFPDSGFYKHISLGPNQAKFVRNTMFLYFPYFRYENAYWMSENANIDFAEDKSFHGQAKINPIRTNIIEETKRWILNVLLDREIYERRIENCIIGEVPRRLFLGYDGPNTKLFSLVNEILTTMLKAKYPQLVSARLGIGRKSNREISVFMTKAGETEEMVAPDISQLSSGELMTLGLATEIIRAFEVTRGAPPG